MASLVPFGARVSIIEPITSQTMVDPVLQIAYQPSPPDFTLRTIIDAVSNSKSPPFEVTVVHPPSLEERARMFQAREQRELLLLLMSATILAIPTFIIGIICMDLLPKSSSLRQFFMKPMWTGNSSRAQWALFFIATPAMFYSARFFHEHSIKELWRLWKKTSRTPVWKRFIRFGTMNLLVRTTPFSAKVVDVTVRLQWEFRLRTFPPSYCWLWLLHNLQTHKVKVTPRRTSTAWCSLRCLS